MSYIDEIKAKLENELEILENRTPINDNIPVIAAATTLSI